MARAAVLGRLSWRLARAVRVVEETPQARTVVLDVPGWPGHVAGQHVDVRLTAPDGYTATRSYSVANASDGETVELTVARVPGGEVSTYLTTAMLPGDEVEVRGPLGGWFVWRPGDPPGPVQLVAGGSGVVPLMAMVRSRAAAGDTAPMRLLHSVRDADAALYRDELVLEAGRPGGIRVTWWHTRDASGARIGRVDAAVVSRETLAPSSGATCYVCGPTGFVEQVTGLLVAAGHDSARIRAERFGPTGGTS